nr:RNA-directed DNA polymerase, eukaryota, reverse transcriptase zinc-binding domain protein [Tanacetum cinerariifolium]
MNFFFKSPPKGVGLPTPDPTPLGNAGRRCGNAGQRRPRRYHTECSKEDGVQQISTSVFVTNFPDQFSAKDLWNTCKQYEYVVDAFIPNRKSKAGKRFGFVRFIKIFDVDSLVNNLCTVWVGRHKIHANLARFQRPPLNKNNNQAKIGKSMHNLGVPPKTKGPYGTSNSYAHAVKGSQSHNLDSEIIPALMLDDSCLNQQNFNCCLMGKVMIKFQSEEGKKTFQSNAGIGTWFAKIQQASTDFFVEGRVAWVDIERVPLKMWSDNTFKCIASKWGTLIHVDSHEDGNFYPKRFCINTNTTSNIFELFKIIYRGKLFWVRAKEDEELEVDIDTEAVPDTIFDDDPIHSNAENDSVEKQKTHSEGPFNIYKLLTKNKENNHKEYNLEDNLKYPSGFTPINDNVNSDGQSNKFTCKRGSILQVMEEMVKVGHTIGYNLEGCIKNIEEIIKSQGVNDETKMENIDLFSIKRCWGNLDFDYVHSASIGDWIPNGTKLLIILIYATQDLSEKKIPKKDERFGSVFNKHGANAFNLFISNAGLEEVPLGGCSYTWCHKSASKMSKLGRFLISESLMHSCPNISAITLERFLSDHRPILMRESHYDYGPVPFRFFHYWFEINGFDKFVEDSWKEAVVVEPNAMTKLVKKLKHLKEKIRLWNKGNTMSSINRKRTLKSDLDDLDLIIDKGCGDVEIVNKRANVVRFLQELENLQSLEAAQKSKIKWAIVGDENSKYFHGILNKKKKSASHSWHFGRWAVWDCGTDKSPGPDGFTFGFYRRYWNILESDVVDAATSFFHHGQFPKGSNSSFIALIPKTRDANMVKDFRPISLIGNMYKIIAKILANRLVLVLGDLVNEVQSAFIADRQILDGPFIINEIVQWCQSKKKQSLVFKVDFEKAFDSIRWDYLDDILRRFGFGDKWCSWIQSCLRSSRGSIIMNGSPTEEFQFHKGLKQGDPLSPFLFILVMETLHISFKRIVDAGMFKGIMLSPSLQLSHLFYVDVVIFMGQWNESNIDTIFQVLECCHRTSGLRLNMSKSKLMGIYVDADKVAQAARKIGCVTLKTSFTYLGSKVGSWNETIEAMAYRLSKWKMKTLSIGGSGSDSLAKNSTWVKWTNVLASKEKDGLGISSLYALNRALMFKWVWRFLSQNFSLWANVINLFMEITEKLVNSFVNKKVGNGSDTLFWEETWHGDVAFKFLFPRAYALESCKNIDVASKLSQNSLAFTFRREPRGRLEQDQFDSLKAMMEGISLVNIRDRWIWSLQNSEDFTVASTRKLIDEFTLSEVSSSTHWIKVVPIKVNVLAWKIKLDNLPTRLNISCRGMDIDSILCPTCSKAVESTKHIFFTCQIASDILHLITSWWNIPYMEVSSYEEWLVWILSLRLSIKHKSVFGGVCYVTWWHIWNFRNKSIFGSESPSKAAIFDEVQSRSFYWCRYRLGVVVQDCEVVEMVHFEEMMRMVQRLCVLDTVRSRDSLCRGYGEVARWLWIWCVCEMVKGRGCVRSSDSFEWSMLSRVSSSVSTPCYTFYRVLAISVIVFGRFGVSEL